MLITLLFIGIKKEQLKAGMRVMSAIEMFVTSSSTLMLILVIYGLGQMAN